MTEAVRDVARSSSRAQAAVSSGIGRAAACGARSRVGESVNEVWRAVVGYESLYEVSDSGRIRSLRRRGGIVAPSAETNGYLRVRFSGLRRSRVAIHAVVAQAFLGPRPVGMQVNHKDGDKHNNAASNLEYVTPTGNMAHAIESGLHAPHRRGTGNGQSKLTPEDVRAIRALREQVSAVEIARRFNVHPATVADIFHGRRWGWLD